MSAFQVFAAIVSLGLIGFAITVIEHARDAIRTARMPRTARGVTPAVETETVERVRPSLRG